MLKARRSVGLAAVVATMVATLAGCGSKDDKKPEKAEPTAAESSEAPAYLPVADDIELTEPGTELAFGEEGVIAFQRRQDQVGVLAVTVERVERTSFDESFSTWEISDQAAARTPYFVRMKVTNVGDVDLGGIGLQNVLWASDGSTLEAPNSYSAKALPACAGGPLPASFASGAEAELCEVFYIAPSRSFEAVAFQPFGGLDAVTWSGEFSPLTDPSKKQPKKKQPEKKKTEKKQPKSEATEKPTDKPTDKPTEQTTDKPSEQPSEKATP